ncbi:MAG: lipopolysaccharide transport periplasmic protein LptA [Rhodobacteraceae bacterium]|nr:lipopolysaccharide transport periplasmic protein LptA [Paracoccaceae bacterium]
MPRLIRPILATLLIAALPFVAAAQGTQVAFSGLKQDPTLPVQVTADQLKVNQTDGSAVFSGHVIVGQGQIRLAADEVRVEYDKGTTEAKGRISRMVATGDVTFTSGGEAAEAKQAIYTIDDGRVVMTGDVLLTQGQSAMSGQTLDIDLKSGTGQMEGRVQTVFHPAPAQPASP